MIFSLCRRYFRLVNKLVSVKLAEGCRRARGLACLALFYCIGHDAGPFTVSRDPASLRTRCTSGFCGPWRAFVFDQFCSFLQCQPVRCLGFAGCHPVHLIADQCVDGSGGQPVAAERYAACRVCDWAVRPRIDFCARTSGLVDCRAGTAFWRGGNDQLLCWQSDVSGHAETGHPCVCIDSWRMVYCTVFMVLVSLVRGHEFIIDPTITCLGSLAWLVVISSVLLL